MDENERQLSTVNWGFFGVLAAIVILMGAATYFLLPNLISRTNTDVIIVKALEEPIKIRPSDQGGKAVDHQNLLVVDILKDGTKGDDQTETLRPAAPNPEPPPISVVETSSSKTVYKAKGKSVESDTINKKADKSISRKVANAQKGNVKKAEEELVTKKPVAKQEDSKKTVKSKIKKDVTVIEGDAPLYMIQLAAFRSVEKATEMAKILSQKHESRLKNVDLDTMRVDTGSNGIFYRIVSIPLPRQEADKMCSLLRRSGQDCFLRKHSKTSP